MIMKRLVPIFMLVLFVAGVAFAAVPSTGSVDAPSKGEFRKILTSTQVPGSIAVIGGNTFKYVYNASSYPSFQGEPAYLKDASADGYSVMEYAGTEQAEMFEGIWYCNTSGGTQINSGTYGWLQIKGIANAYVSAESTSIAEKDVLIAKVMSGLATTDAAVRCFFTRDRATSTEANVNKTYAYPKALEASTAAAAAASKKVYLGQ